MVRAQVHFTNFCIAWLNLPPPPSYHVGKDDDLNEGNTDEEESPQNEGQGQTKEASLHSKLKFKILCVPEVMSICKTGECYENWTGLLNLSFDRVFLIPSFDGGGGLKIWAFLTYFNLVLMDGGYIHNRYIEKFPYLQNYHSKITSTKCIILLLFYCFEG